MAVMIAPSPPPPGLASGSPIDKVGDPWILQGQDNLSIGVPVPKDAIAGDFMVLWQSFTGVSNAFFSSGPFSSPAGAWTLQGYKTGAGTNFVTLLLWTHLVADGEAGTVLSLFWGWPAPGSSDANICRTYRYVDPTNPIDHLGSGSTSGGDTASISSGNCGVSSYGALIDAALAYGAVTGTVNPDNPVNQATGLDAQAASTNPVTGMLTGVIDIGYPYTWGGSSWVPHWGGATGTTSAAGWAVALRPVSTPQAPTLSIPGLTPDLVPAGYSSWTPKAGTSIISTTNDYLHLQATAAGNVDAQSGPQGSTVSTSAPGMIPVSPNTPYSGSLQFWSSEAARACKVRLDWYTSGGVFISQNDGTSVTEVQNGPWITSTCVATSPANAAYCQLEGIITAAANGEDHFLSPVHRLRVLNSFDAAGSAGDPLTISIAYTATAGRGPMVAWAAARQLDATLTNVGWWDANLEVWSPTQVLNVGDPAEYTWPASAWVNDHSRWQLYAAIVEGNLDLTSALAGPIIFTADDKPTVVPTAPFGDVTTATPAITWAPLVATSTAEVAWQVRVFSSDQYEAAGFDPALSAAQADSTVVSSAATSWTPPALRGGGFYRAYIRVQQTGGQWSDWEFVGWYAAYNNPARPLVATLNDTDPVTGHPRVKITVTGQDAAQVLTPADSTLEGGLGTWVGHAGASVSGSATAHSGAQSLAVAFAAGSGSWAEVDWAGYPIGPGETVTLTGWIRAVATARNLGLGVDWWDAGGVGIGSANLGGVTDAVGSWTKIPAGVLTPPAAARFFSVFLQPNVAVAAGEVHLLDDVKAWVGPAGAAAGLDGTTFVTVYRYDRTTQDLVAVRFGQSVPIPWPSQVVSVYDPEPPPSLETLYQARVFSTLAAGAVP